MATSDRKGRPGGRDEAARSPEIEEVFQRLAEAVADETPIDWEAEDLAHPEISARLSRLRVIQKIAEAHRDARVIAPQDRRPGQEPLLFEWGRLRVIELLGEGSFGQVYRAYDPLLQRHVALKLVRENAAASAGGAAGRRFLEEARRMARVKHPNVLAIHGADVHEGREGFWSDLVEGSTLEERLAAGGACAAAEATAIGVEICRALSAVHAAGLVHGDVKGSNVMRDTRGRILLTDFGAGRDLGSDATVIGTPLSLAPELFHGEAPSPRSDLYALGVLLYRLVSGRYPTTASTMAELAEKHDRGERTRLLDVRPDLPVAWVHAVERALCSDPSRRYATAGEMEAALSAALLEPATPSPRSPRTSRFLILLAPLLAAALIAVLLPRLKRPGTTDSPAPLAAGSVETGVPPPSPQSGERSPVHAALSANVAVYRSRGAAREALAPGALVRSGDALFMEIKGPEPMHAYVLNEDAQGGMFVLYPLASLDLRNPLQPGIWHRLPGSRNGEPQNWQVTSGRGRESFLVVASRAPLRRLEDLLAKLPAAASGRPIIEARVDPRLLSTTRGVGGLTTAASEAAAPGLLPDLARQLTQDAADPADLWIQEFALYNLGR